MASSLAPQQVYEVGSLRGSSSYALRLTAHNAAGATTATSPGGGVGGLSGLEEGPPLPFPADPRLLASGAASALALALTLAAALLCVRRRECHSRLQPHW